MRIYSFQPIINPFAVVLILGSMPGLKSLEMGQYYAHPKNQFWKILGKLCEFDPDLPYLTRVEHLLESRIALWDVLKTCERIGSLDHNIEQKSEIPNELEVLVSSLSSLRAIAFNGNKARIAFQHHILPKLEKNEIHRLEFLLLPSTSPANARLSMEQKYSEWQKISEFIQDDLPIERIRA